MLRRCRLLWGWSYMGSTWAWVCSLGESTTRSAPDSANSSVEMLTTAADSRPPFSVNSRCESSAVANHRYDFR